MWTGEVFGGIVEYGFLLFGRLDEIRVLIDEAGDVGRDAVAPVKGVGMRFICLLVTASEALG